MEELDDSEASSDESLERTCSDLGAAAAHLQSCSDAMLTDDSHVEILNTTEVVGFMNQMITEISAIIEEDATVTRILLSHFRWDKHALLDRFYGKSKRALFEEVNLTNLTMHNRSYSNDSIASEVAFSDALSNLNATTGEPAATHNHSLYKCGICLTAEELPPEDSFNLVCDHKFCKDCWKEYLTHSILKEGMAQNISCAGYGCEVLVSDATVMEFISDEQIRDKYLQLISNSFVSCSRNLRWCPAPNCGKAIKADILARQVTCQCGEKFCFQCGEEWHQPVKCDWMANWKLRVDSDSSTVSWIASNTKECPKCKATIEKNGGCNHMICRKNNCLHEFCWVCLGPWQEHGQNAWYNCNRFNEKTSKNARTAMDQSRSSMLRFLHYYNRYANHKRSMNLESEIYSKVQDRIEEIQKSHGQAWNEVNFLKMAVDMLCKARRTLMNTYVFAYFVKQNNQSIIFEDNQRDLELSTEHLSEYLERDIYKTTPNEMKQKVNDKLTYCGQRCTALLSHMQEGYDFGWWELDDLRCQKRLLK